ncbi:MAG TPA: hypothetical protein VIS77_02680 [Burkholderiales bacterium]
MADPQRLTLAFMEAHPRDAARVLERIPAAQAAELFEHLPARVAAPAFAVMLPTAAARNLDALDDEAATALLAALGTQAAVIVLRHVGEPRRTQLVERLPTHTAIASRLLLGYPDDSAGAWCDPEVVLLGADVNAADAIARVRAAPGARIEDVYVAGSNERLLGTVSLAVLLRAPAATLLGELATRPVAVLPAATPLSGAIAHRAWQQVAELPVIERGEQLVGVLRRATLTRVLARQRAAAEEAPDANVLGVVAGGYWHMVSGLIGACVAALPGARPLSGVDHEH